MAHSDTDTVAEDLRIYLTYIALYGHRPSDLSYAFNENAQEEAQRWLLVLDARSTKVTKQRENLK